MNPINSGSLVEGTNRSYLWIMVHGTLDFCLVHQIKFDDLEKKRKWSAVVKFIRVRILGTQYCNMILSSSRTPSLKPGLIDMASLAQLIKSVKLYVETWKRLWGGGGLSQG